MLLHTRWGKRRYKSASFPSEFESDESPRGFVEGGKSRKRLNQSTKIWAYSNLSVMQALRCNPRCGIWRFQTSYKLNPPVSMKKAEEAENFR